MFGLFQNSNNSSVGIVTRAFLALSLSDGGHQRRKVRLGISVQMGEDTDVWFRLFRQ